MDLADTFLFLLTGVFLLFWWRRCSTSGKTVRNLPPAVPGWPLVGNLFQVIMERRPFIYVVADLRKKYGPIFTLQMGQRKMVIVTSSELTHEALVQRGPLFATRPPDSPIRLVFSMGKCAINSAEYGPLWRTLRRNFVTEMISPTRVRQCAWIRKWAFETHLERMKKEGLENGYVEVMNNCRLTICSILICICFGAKISEEWIRDIESVLKDVMMMTSPKLPDFLPVLTPLFRGHLKAAKELRKKQLKCVTPLIKGRRAYVESGGNPASTSLTMASAIGAAYVDSLFGLEAPTRGKLGDDELVTLVSEIISAGTDTSATATEWALLHLVQDHDIQQRLYEEVVGVVGKDGSIAEEDTEKMPFLSAIVKETFRRHPPSHFMLSHGAIKETELAGYTIPTDVSVEFYTAWHTQNPDAWKDPDEFRPERFLPGGEGYDVDITGTKAIRMMPFGAGRRICPAWSLGLLHINMMLARMIQAFKWVPFPGSPPDPTETYAFTIVMKNPLKAVILPR
ncbi:uncharacterized protein [Phyllobates terribilis]|uniref:uncharacterized protein n=1 Tax=Phyllobates terribilis TaxID=111132 RepID=UPI003CCA9F5E